MSTHEITAREMGRRGGLSTAARYGAEHFKRMSDLGKAARLARPKYDRAAIVRRYVAGELVREIAADLGATTQTIRNYVNAAGVARSAGECIRLAWARRRAARCIR